MTATNRNGNRPLEKAGLAEAEVSLARFGIPMDGPVTTTLTMSSMSALTPTSADRQLCGAMSS